MSKSIRVCKSVCINATYIFQFKIWKFIFFFDLVKAEEMIRWSAHVRRLYRRTYMYLYRYIYLHIVLQTVLHIFDPRDSSYTVQSHCARYCVGCKSTSETKIERVIFKHNTYLANTCKRTCLGYVAAVWNTNITLNPQVSWAPRNLSKDHP